MGGQRGVDLDATLDLLLDDASPVKGDVRAALLELTLTAQRHLATGGDEVLPDVVYEALEDLRADLTRRLRGIAPDSDPAAETSPGDAGQLGAAHDDVDAAPPGSAFNAPMRGVGYRAASWIGPYLQDVVRGLDELSWWEPPNPLDPGRAWEHLYVLGLTVSPGTRDALERRLRDLLDGGSKTVVPASTSLGHPGWDPDDDRDEDFRASLASHLPDHAREMVDSLDRLLCLGARHPWAGWAHPALAGDVRRLDRESLQSAREDVMTSMTGLASEFRKIIACDSAIRSVVPFPLPSTPSWWVEQVQLAARFAREYAVAEHTQLVVMKSPAQTPRPETASEYDRVNFWLPAGIVRGGTWQLGTGYRSDTTDVRARLLKAQVAGGR